MPKLYICAMIPGSMAADLIAKESHFYRKSDYDALEAELSDQVRVTEEHQRLRYQCEIENTRLTTDAQRDYEGMREFQAKFIAADHRIRALEAAAEKVHGIIAEYWGPCMGSVESLLTLREAVGERATTWLPKVSDLPRVTSLETKGDAT